ncbi:NIPSNAP family protein [Pseudooceanicola sp. HF7]|uniref:NIPSNAP family protein n=1 Tax=Pseudooceanicola sp. HF7 TaxID=2721560 RepID=UPI0014301805|nr:NIPSNAP family protein [Pseudooceanicola sp. HF7]NIZ08579.1 NIPSNAP family protein [Pseudooceanicola sp. HF7]
MIYDLTTLALLPNRIGAVMPKLAETYANFSSTGRPLGVFSIEFGGLNRFHFLTEYENVEALNAERARCLEAYDPYRLAEHLGGVERTAFKALGFARPLKPGNYGPFYEFRTYTVAPHGMDETEAAWEKGLPAREEISPLLTIMKSVEGAPTKMLHIWPYKTLDERTAARAEGSRRGVWPPAGGSVHLTSLQSELAVAAACSDLA